MRYLLLYAQSQFSLRSPRKSGLWHLISPLTYIQPRSPSDLASAFEAAVPLIFALTPGETMRLGPPLL